MSIYAGKQGQKAFLVLRDTIICAMKHVAAIHNNY